MKKVTDRQKYQPVRTCDLVQNTGEQMSLCDRRSTWTGRLGLNYEGPCGL